MKRRSIEDFIHRSSSPEMIASPLTPTKMGTAGMALLSYYGFVISARILIDDAEVLHSYRRAFFLRRHQLLSGNEYQYQKGTFLLLMHCSYLPKNVQESIVNDSIMKADSMAKDPNNAYRKKLPIAVEILIRSEAAAIACRRRRDRVLASRDGHDAIARATRESMQVVKFVPATKSSVEDWRK